MQRRWSLRSVQVAVQTKLGVVLALLGFVALAWMVEFVAGLSHPIAFGRVMALMFTAVPCLVWLGFFHWQDRGEPEPKHFVAGVAVLGGLVAAPVAEFILGQLAPTVALAQHGSGMFALDRIVFAIFIVGLAQEMCKYAVVRYSIYLSSEFDQPVDGVVYMMSVGTGFALWLNYHRLMAPNGAMMLGDAASQAVATTLAHASFAGVLGYVLGRAKFSRRSTVMRSVLLGLGLVAAAVINGHFALVESKLNASAGAAGGTSAWTVAYAAAIAVVVFTVLRAVLQRDAKRQDDAARMSANADSSDAAITDAAGGESP